MKTKTKIPLILTMAVSLCAGCLAEDMQWRMLGGAWEGRAGLEKTPEFLRVKLNTATDVCGVECFAFDGQWDPKKNTRMLIKARASNPDTRVTLVGGWGKSALATVKDLTGQWKEWSIDLSGKGDFLSVNDPRNLMLHMVCGNDGKFKADDTIDIAEIRFLPGEDKEKK
jgi:hypothetical protein